MTSAIRKLARNELLGNRTSLVALELAQNEFLSGKTGCLLPCTKTQALTSSNSGKFLGNQCFGGITFD